MKFTKKSVLKLIALLLIATSVMFIVASPLNNTNNVIAASSSDSKVQGYEDRIAKLEAEQKAYEKKIQEAKQNANDYLKEKEYLDKQIANLSEQITTANELVIEYTNAINAKSEEIEVKQAEIDEKFKQFQERMRISYEEGSMGYLAMLFSSNSISDFLTGLERMTNMLEYDKRTMKELNDQKAALMSEKAAKDELLASQKAVYENLEKTESELEAKAKEAADFYNKAIGDEAEFEKKLAQAQAAEKKANAELEAYLEEMAKKNNGSYEGGALSWPLSKSNNKITSKYGTRTYKIWGRWVTDFHLGIDVGVSTGTSVYAAAGGTVEIAKWDGSYGYYILINHGGGYATLYAHNSQLLVKQGQKVKRGDLISKSGSTGNSSGPHLHFEVRINGKHQDPINSGYLSYPALIYT